MKITPISQGTGTPGTILGNIEIGTTNNSKKESAKKAFLGEKIEEKESTNLQNQIGLKKRTLQMKTNATPERYLETATEQLQSGSAENDKTAKIDHSEATQRDEATKPLSPQFAALARQRRALQAKERELAEKEKALQTSQTQTQSGISLESIKADPLSVLQQAGVSYDDLTQAIMNGAPAPNLEIQSLKDQIQSLEKVLEDKFSARDSETEQQVLRQIKRDAEVIAAGSDQYELVKTTNSTPEVVELIHRNFKENGELMDVEEALKLVEEDLEEQVLKVAKAKKIQSKLSPSLAVSEPKVSGQMKTLTGRDGANINTLTSKQRAVLAFNGQLRRG